MKKTVTANISGFIFQIDEDAFEKLSSYLERVRGKLASEPGSDEIMADIENRIAETLQKRVSANQPVINLYDVQELVSQLGEPEQIFGEEGDTAQSSQQFAYEEKSSKRLYRDSENAIIGGVAGGLGAFFGIDPTLVRVLFALSFFMGFGIMLYIILWIVVPKAKTTAERLEMRGQKVNISNIKKSVEDELKDAGDNLKSFASKTEKSIKDTEARYKKKRTRVSSEDSYLETGVERFFKSFGRVVVIVVGVFLLFFGTVLLGSFLAAILGLPVNLGTGIGTHNVSVSWLLELVLAGKGLVTLALIGLSLLIGVPLLAMIYGGVKLIFGYDYKVRFLSTAATSLWIAGLVICITLLVVAGQNFASHRELPEETFVEHSMENTLVVDVDKEMLQQWRNNPDVEMIFDNNFLLIERDQELLIGSPKVYLKTSTDEKLKVIVTKSARGRNSRNATNNASGIEYHFEKTDSILVLDPFFWFDRTEGWRVQELTVEVLVPEGLKVETTQDLVSTVRLRNRLPK